MAADTAADPNTITDPTGGAPNFNVLDAFQQFGYQPTQAEIDALAPSFEGRYNVGGTGMSAIGQYVNYQNQIKEFNANDPLTGIQNQMKDLITQNQSSVLNLSSQLQDVLKSAPELFGSLTPDQISEYLAPLQTSFDQQIAQVQGAAAATGTAGSSSQAAALAEAQNQFQQTVLSTGLNIGLTSQANQANALQAQINNLFSQTGQAISSEGQAAGQQSAQELGESQLIGSLPSFLNAQSAQENAIAKANQSPGFLSKFYDVTNAVNQGSSVINTINSGMPNFSFGPFSMGAPSNANTGSGTNPYSAPASSPSQGSSPTQPSFASTSPGGSNYQAPNMNAPGYGQFYGSNSNPYSSSAIGG